MSDLLQLIRREILLFAGNGESASSKREIEEIKKQIKDIVADVIRISNVVDSIKGQLGELSTRVSAAESGISQNSHRIDGLERDVSSISNSISGIDSRLSELGNRVDATERRVGHLDAVTGNLTERTSRLESEVSTITSDLGSLNTRVTTELNDVRGAISSMDGRLSTLEAEAVTSVGKGLQKDGNSVRVIVGTGMWFDQNNALQLFLSNQQKGLGFVGNGMVVKIDTQYFSFDNNGNITLNSNISGLPLRTDSLEASRIDVVAAPLAIQSTGSTRLLRLMYEAVDFVITNDVLTLRNRSSMPTFKFPLELNSADNSVSIHRNYRIRLGQWSGLLEYHTPNLRWNTPITVNLMRVDDWLVLSFNRFSTRVILASGKFVLNFVTGLSPGWATGSTEPSTTTNPLSTTFAAVQFVNGSSRIDAFRILGVANWTDGELEVANYGGTYTDHTSVDWAPMTIMYPCMG
uniref:Attachment protein n=1 Tax=Mammalian orthoreovirus TaxID=351073 RepID=A0A7L9AX82_9REOV|nr:attachment protein [Mammalian orthoreovirus]